MRKILLLCTLICTLLSSCSSDSIMDSNTDSETRAVTNSTQGTGMAPSAYLTNYFKSEGIAKMQKIKIVETANSSYFATMQFDGGYTGLQTTTDLSLGTPNIQIFSYWDLNTSLGSLAKHIYTSPGTVGKRFGGEGEGAQTRNGYKWKLNVWYNTVVRAWKVGTDLYVACFIQDESSQEWLHTATLARPESSSNKFLGVDTYSFLENWLGTNSTSDGRYKRKVFFKDAWNLNVANQWEKPNALSISASRNNTIHANSFNGNYDSAEGAYFLEHGGNVTPNAAFKGGTQLTISPSIESKNSQKKPNLTIGEITAVTVTEDAGGNSVINWSVDSKKSPQLSYLIKVSDNRGAIVYEMNQTKPEERSQIITGLKKGDYTLSIQMTDIFNQVSAKRISFRASGTSSDTEVNSIDPDLWYRIKSKKNGNYIAIKDFYTEALIQSSPIASANNSDIERQWGFVKQGDYYLIVNRKSNKVIDVPGSAQNNGTNLIQYGVNRGYNQLWKVIYVNNSTFYIQSCLNSLPLIYSGESSVANSPVSIYSNIRSLGNLTEDWILEVVK